MGGVATIAAVTSAVASTAMGGKQIFDSRQAQKESAKKAKYQMRVNEITKKNLLEEQLAQRRARIGSLGISSNGGSVLASQNRLVNDTYENIHNDNYEYQNRHINSYNNYQSKLTDQILGGFDSSARMIK